MPRPKENLVLDFDGTLTDIEKEAEPYLDVYHGLLADKLGINKQELRDVLNETRSRVLQSPHIFGWEHNGVIVAPVMADPYIENRVIVQESLPAF